MFTFGVFFKFSRLPKKSCSAFLQLLRKLIQAMLGEKYRAWKAQSKKKYVTLKKLNTDEKYQNGEKPKEIQGGLTPLWQHL